MRCHIFLCDLFEVWATLLVLLFLLIVQSEPYKLQYVAVAPTCHYKEVWPCQHHSSSSKPVGRSLTLESDTSFPFVLVLCSGMTLHTPWHCCWRRKWFSVAMTSSAEEKLCQIQALREGWESPNRASP